jgi:hypothetical protein
VHIFEALPSDRSEQPPELILCVQLIQHIDGAVVE